MKKKKTEKPIVSYKPKKEDLKNGDEKKTVENRDVRFVFSRDHLAGLSTGLKRTWFMGVVVFIVIMMIPMMSFAGDINALMDAYVIAKEAAIENRQNFTEDEFLRFEAWNNLIFDAYYDAMRQDDNSAYITLILGGIDASLRLFCGKVDDVAYMDLERMYYEFRYKKIR